MLYVYNSELEKALIESKKRGKLTDEAIEMFILIVNGLSKIYSYENFEDRKECISAGIEDLIKYWNRYDPNKSNNAFAFITQIAHNGIKKGWKRIYSHRSVKTISFSKIERYYLDINK